VARKNREREIARRRHERRQARLAAERARRRRRLQVISSVVAVLVVAGGVTVAAVAFTGGGSSSPSASLSLTPTPTATIPTALAAAPSKCAAITPNPPIHGDPVVPPVNGKAPTKLVVKDIKVGHGKPAKKGATLSVKYVGISCSTGKEFDSTAKDGGTPFSVTPLGTANVIPGWNKGLIGVRAGGSRELIIPATLGYGPSGQPPAILGNETLIFRVDVLSVKA
jgi:peptidylprolyl isomerase